MFTTRIAAAAAGASIAASAILAPSAFAAEILEIGDKCYIEEAVTQEEVVGTRTIAEPATRQGDWPVGEVEGPEGWTFEHTGASGDQAQDSGAITADIPAGTPAGEYTATAYHFGYSKNQVSEIVTYTVVEEDITESRTWTDREEVPCAADASDESASGDNSGASADESGSGTSGQQAGFVDYKVLAQQQAMNAPAPAAAAAPAAVTPAAEQVTPAPAAQQMQLANNGIGGTLTALAVGLLAAAAGAGLLLKRRAN